MSGRRLWIVGHWPEGAPANGSPWQFQGVFTTKDRAIDEAQDIGRCFIGPVDVNASVPRDTTGWPGGEWVG